MSSGKTSAASAGGGNVEATFAVIVYQTYDNYFELPYDLSEKTWMLAMGDYTSSDGYQNGTGGNRLAVLYGVGLNSANCGYVATTNDSFGYRLNNAAGLFTAQIVNGKTRITLNGLNWMYGAPYTLMMI